MVRRIVLYMVLLFSANSWATEGKRCLIVYSYHVGYPWNDTIDQRVTEVLQDECEIVRFYMDSKRNPQPQFIRDKAQQAHLLVQQLKPDVVLAFDDNASKYLVVPYLRDGDVPVVFAGVNWDAKEYGYPYSKATGMVEIAPLEPLFLYAQQLLGRGGKRPLQVHVIDANRYSAIKEFSHIEKRFSKGEMIFYPHFVENFEQWRQAFIAAQSGDIVLLMNNAGIVGWSSSDAEAFVRQHGKALSVAIHGWMKRLVLLTMAKEPEEQGEWAGEAAAAILSGINPKDIPMVSNRRWSSYINQSLLNQINVPLPERLIQRSRWLEEERNE